MSEVSAAEVNNLTDIEGMAQKKQRNLQEILSLEQTAGH